MNKSFFFASIFTILALGLSYFDYIPFYISITIAICSFIMAVSNSINSSIQSLQKLNNDIQIKNRETIQKSFDNIEHKLERFSDVINTMTSENNSHNKQIQGLWENTISEIKEFSDMTVKLDEDLMHQYDKLRAELEEKIQLLHSSLKGNSTEISKLNETIGSVNQKVVDNVSLINNVVTKTTAELGNAVNTATNNLDQQTKDIIAQLSIIIKSIEIFADSIKSADKSNTTLCASISEHIETVKSSISSICNKNEHIIEDFSASMDEKIEELLNEIKETATEHTELIADGENKIGDNIKQLCNNLTTNLEKLEIDVDDMCNSIKNMQQMSKAVEQSDQELLTKLSKICR